MSFSMNTVRVGHSRTHMITLSLMIRLFFKGSSAFFYLTLPVISVYFSIGHTKAIISASLFLLGSAASLVVLGPLADFYDRKKVLVYCVGLHSLGALLAAMSFNVAMFWSGLFLMGAGISILPTIGAAMINSASVSMKDC